MTMLSRGAAAVLIGIAVLATGFPAAAAEFIRSYHSVIELARDGSLTVTETIEVNAEGRDIRRGIFRDFPLYALDARGRRTRVDFEVVSVERNGSPEDWHTESISGGVRIYAGSADTLLSPGEHVYQITYRTDRQIRYFEDHDELYWNVTGDGWRFPMDEVTATVVLPQGVSSTGTAFFTGRRGETGKDARSFVEGNEIFFATTRPLRVGEELTVAVKFPKGSISPPDSARTTTWFLRDNLDLFLGFGGFLIVALYYARAWWAVGRDPAPGVMVPRWDPPDGISPALVNYIDNKGFSGAGWTALSASVLDLAVKGYVVLEDLSKSIVIRRTEKDISDTLPGGQAALLSAIGGAGNMLVVDKANGKRVETVGQTFRSAIEKEHRGKYYRSNSGYTVFGVFLSIAFLVALLAFGSLDEDSIALIVLPVFFAVFFGVFAVGFGKGLRRGASLRSRIGSIVGLAVIGFVAVSSVGGIMTTLVLEMAELHHLPVLFAVGGIILLNVLFLFLMGAPTPLGRKMMDGIEGLRTYLTLAEKDRMNMQGAPTMSPRHFETLLPYAVALGVEKPWTKTFDTWLASAAAGAAAAAAYQPSWYSGDFGSGRFADRIGGFSSSMASTIASTIPEPPRSSSSGFSGGGGSAGGGGGGGGGGGW